MNVSSQQFFEAWRTECSHCSEALISDWHRRKEYNSRVFNEGGILNGVARRLGLCVYCEYYSHDAVFFKKEDLVPQRRAGQTWLRRIRIAFEHEHSFDDRLYEEVSHLMITDCDLRVLIAYPKDQEHWEREGQVLHETILGSERSEKFSVDSSFLAILGFERPSTEEQRWCAYVFHRERWKPLASS